jgi:hypothetical protein
MPTLKITRRVYISIEKMLHHPDHPRPLRRRGGRSCTSTKFNPYGVVRAAWLVFLLILFPYGESATLP